MIMVERLPVYREFRIKLLKKLKVLCRILIQQNFRVLRLILPVMIGQEPIIISMAILIGLIIILKISLSVILIT